MSTQTQIASRYANAFFDLVVEGKKQTAVEKELNALSQLVQENEDFVSFLRNPSLGVQEQRNVIEALVKKSKLSGLTENLLLLLCQNRRLDILADVINCVADLFAQSRNELEAEVIAPKKLSKAQEKTVVDLLSKKTGKKIQMKVTIDESIIGGLIVKYGSFMIDDSVKTKLEKLKRQMKGVA